MSLYPPCHLSQVRVLTSFLSPAPGSFPRCPSCHLSHAGSYTGHPSCRLSQVRIQGILLVTCPRFVSWYPSCHLSKVCILVSFYSHLSQARILVYFLSAIPGLYPGILLVTCPTFVSWYPSCHLFHVCILVSFLSPVPRLYPGILLVTCPRFVFVAIVYLVGTLLSNILYIWPIIRLFYVLYRFFNILCF